MTQNIILIGEHNMNITTENHVRKAVDLIGGVTVTSNLLGVSNGCVHRWIKCSRINKIFYARKLAELAGMPVEFIRPI